MPMRRSRDPCVPMRRSRARAYAKEPCLYANEGLVTSKGISIHGSELVAVAQGLVEYRGSRTVSRGGSPVSAL